MATGLYAPSYCRFLLFSRGFAAAAVWWNGSVEAETCDSSWHVWITGMFVQEMEIINFILKMFSCDSQISAVLI